MLSPLLAEAATMSNESPSKILIATKTRITTASSQKLSLMSFFVSDFTMDRKMSLKMATDNKALPLSL
jgi:hypothetical protein